MQQVEDRVIGTAGEGVRELWASALDIVKGELNELVFKTWFQDTEPLDKIGPERARRVEWR